MLKVGDICYSVVISDDRKVEYWEYVLRTIRCRPRSKRKMGYWFAKLPGVTWGKVSKKHGDFGWLPNIGAFRVALPIEMGRPFGTTKAGELRKEIARLRAALKGETDPEYIAEVEADLAVILRAQKRI